MAEEITFCVIRAGLLLFPVHITEHLHQHLTAAAAAAAAAADQAQISTWSSSSLTLSPAVCHTEGKPLN